MDRGSWWATVHGVLQSLTQLKRLSTFAQAMQETPVQSLGREDSLEKEMVTHSSILAWRIPWTEDPGRIQYMGSQESDMT